MPRSTQSPAKTRQIRYSPHPGIAMIAKWVSELKEKTGRSVDEWMKYIRQNGPDDLPARRAWLKEKHNLGTYTAAWLAERVDGQPTWDETPEQYLAIAPTYVDDMFGGSKAPMRPVGDALMRLAQEISSEIKFCPCKTIVPFYRNRVIAQIKPATKSRIDFGLSLGADIPFTARLKDTGGLKKKDRITHKVEVTSLADIDKELADWLQVAFDRDA